MPIKLAGIALSISARNRAVVLYAYPGADQPANAALAQSIRAPRKVTLVETLRTEVFHFIETQ
jgi:hypothetical protein